MSHAGWLLLSYLPALIRLRHSRSFPLPPLPLPNEVFRERGDAENLLGVLDLCLRNNFAGVESFRLYSETFFGSKQLIERYVEEVEQSLDFVQKTDPVSGLICRRVRRNYF